MGKIRLPFIDSDLLYRGSLFFYQKGKPAIAQKYIDILLVMKLIEFNTMNILTVLLHIEITVKTCFSDHLC